ncbi:hypothetical protein HAX54_042076 [Datura stramonium]|uniref:Uncharacterized protein n=1 Tax=Datura stramonium TaxID=4076 RepID=A0ABS8SM31_DATST|nr:hypothetical protein [Datura stramonium]
MEMRFEEWVRFQVSNKVLQDKPSSSDATNSGEVRVETSTTRNMDLTNTGEYVADHLPVHTTDQHHANQLSVPVESNSDSEGESDIDGNSS